MTLPGHDSVVSMQKNLMNIDIAVSTASLVFASAESIKLLNHNSVVLMIPLIYDSVIFFAI